jgi:negative regulator of sigma E activity
MNEEDLRDCFAMFALVGAMMRQESWTPKQLWDVADEMVQARKAEPAEGIVAIKTRRKK